MSPELVEIRAVLDHPTARVWEIMRQLESYPRFFAGISWCAPVGPGELLPGARYVVRTCFDGGSVIEDEVSVAIHRPHQELVLSLMPSERRWLALRLTDLGDGRTDVFLQLALPQRPGRPVARGRDMAAKLHEAVRLIGDHLSGRPWDSPLARRDHADGVPGLLATGQTLIRSGVLGPARPDRSVRQLTSLARWGGTLAGGYGAATARSPRAIAIADETSTLTFEELDERTTRLANGLINYGVGPGGSVALICRNHGAMVESMLACSKLGADVVLLNTGLSSRQLSDVVRAQRPAVLLADDEFADLSRDASVALTRVRTWPERRSTDPTLADVLAKGSARELRPPSKPGRVVVLTSGTTAAPKGARRPTPRGLSETAAMLSRIPLRVGERMLLSAPLFHTWGFAALQLSMPLRASVILQRRFDPEDALRAIEMHRCTSMIVVPVMLQRILDLPAHVRNRYDTSSLRIVASSGSAVPGAVVTEFMDTFGDVLYNLYGSTEVSWASIADPFDLRCAPTTAGRPPAGTQVALLDAKGTVAPPGTPGRIFVGNGMLFEGYTDNTTKTVQRGLMATGDVGYVDADGRLFVSGRDDEMIVSGGENVFPRPVEELLTALPEVDEVAVIGVPDEQYGQRLAAYVVPRPGARLDADQVRSHVRERLARFAVPRDVFFISELPRNATGKVLKRVLAAGEQLPG
jgi:acyl-CoA synthetase (AMP-forming)/AMP-acid ligase II/uncharacterized protein YndB with AHSA1/START domain